jgi:DNA-directed RNA polymerase subunit RPC12/RpoP
MTDKTHRFPCPGCGADLEFEPRGGVLECSYCGRREAIPQSAEQVVERSYEEYLHPREGQVQQLAAGALEAACQGCGATVTFTPPEVSEACPFCGRRRVAQPKSADPLVAPQAVLPFSVTRETAREAIQQWLAGLWFAPNALKRLARQESIGGVYLPFWTYDAFTTSHYRGQRGEHYHVTETYHEGGRTKTRSVRKTRWSPAGGTVERWHDDVLVAATRAISPARLGALAPWDLPSLRPYDPAYLAGHRAQRYQVDMAEGFELAKAEMDPVIRRAVEGDIGGDEQRIDDLATSYAGVTFKHLLLPVYLGAYSFQAKTYQVMVNARTGQVDGERPYSVWKIMFFVLFILSVIALVAVLSDR